ncbi:PRC-barrel domain-containing protein [Cereibacter sp. SYSU M97828]|nr:PRC-barrel domain-containing protein [Cereibacter flavus]
MDHKEHIPLSAVELTEENLLGAPVYGPGDETVGSIGDLSIREAGEVRMAIIDVGGFLGIGTKHIAVPFNTLQFFRQGLTGPVHAHIGLSKDQVKDLPDHDREEEPGFVVYVPPLI